jgi:hypothetical protein
LAPFQKEGVQFMFKCLAKRSGVILGDEMVSIVRAKTGERNEIV